VRKTFGRLSRAGSFVAVAVQSDSAMEPHRQNMMSQTIRKPKPIINKITVSFSFELIFKEQVCRQITLTTNQLYKQIIYMILGLQKKILWLVDFTNAKGFFLFISNIFFWIHRQWLQ
jgi:hypothetical protein